MIDIEKMHSSILKIRHIFGDDVRATQSLGEVFEIITRLREAEKDAARMNWLESNGFSIEMADYNRISCNRSAIDQAMKEKGDE